MELDEHICHCNSSNEQDCNARNILITDKFMKKMFGLLFDGQINKNHFFCGFK